MIPQANSSAHLQAMPLELRPQFQGSQSRWGAADFVWKQAASRTTLPGIGIQTGNLSTELFVRSQI
jgi:hypothetical protein